MAEVIQGILEDMLPDLLDFLTRDIFNDSEIKQIIKTRREFEYKLMRPQPLKRHFLAAVQYELSLEDQRVRRRNELGINKPSNSDRSSNLYFSSSSRG
jgi:U3 small nucleolar RNA-associated protein 6